MNSLNPFACVIVGAIMAASIYWQVRLWQFWFDGEEKSEESIGLQVAIPSGLAAVIGIGVIVVALIALVDADRPTFDFWVFLGFVGKAVVLVVATLAKTLAGILVAGFVVSSQVYHLLEHGELTRVPLISSLLEWVFAFAPDWMSTVWLVGQTLWALATGSLVSLVKMSDN